MARHVRKGDTVVVIAGNDKGKVGEVLRVDAKAGKVLVQGVNRVYRHLRPSRRNPQGGRIEKEMPIDISNVLPLDPKTSRPTRVGFRVGAEGAKERVARRSGEVLSVVRPKKDKA
ncbi:MAG: 50S ribosomal protein L24 [Planctomycetales bacterium 4484_123]|nr:MAG: 50S ribosomal protein L24 [Planctomycetales bacterium 4484_123]